MSPEALLDLLRRELRPTPGRAGATLRLTMACLITVALVMMFRMPGSLIAFVMIYLITQEDAAATVLGSVLGWLSLTVALVAAFLALQLSLDTPWLRICFLAAFVFCGLFLKRALTLGALGSAFGIPALMAMLLPDIAPPSAEGVVEGLLWLWWCATLGLAINAAVQLLFSPGDSLSLLRRELHLRLQAVEHALRRRAGDTSVVPLPVSLDTLSIAGTTRPAALLKTAGLVDAQARARHETLAAQITLADRLVTAARALELAPGPLSAEADARLTRAAEACRLLSQGLQRWERPPAGAWVTLARPQSRDDALLADVEDTLDQMARAVPGAPVSSGPRPGLLVPDAFENPDYVRFATKGTIAILICYFTFIGFDYPEIYTCLITVFVVALATTGASHQKAILRFGGAAVGALMGLVALVFVLPSVDGIGGFLLVFGAASAASAWVYTGTPRLAYGGYQVGLAFWKATLQGFGVAVSAQVLRDRLIGIAFGLVVFTLVDRSLWPQRARDVLRVRLAEALRLLAELARAGAGGGAGWAAARIDSWRVRISLKLAEVQALVESSKFEPGAPGLGVLQRVTGRAQIASVFLLSATRHPGTPAVDTGLAARLEAEAARLADGHEPPAADLFDPLLRLAGAPRTPLAGAGAS